MASSVGIREAKIHLSRLMKRVQQGKEVVITDRGKAVGKIVPINSRFRSLLERIQDLEARGLIEERKSPPQPLPPPIPVGGDLAQKYLQEDPNQGT
jgi:prevent-host-death family protein